MITYLTNANNDVVRNAISMDISKENQNAKGKGPQNVQGVDSTHTLPMCVTGTYVPFAMVGVIWHRFARDHIA